MRVGSVIYNRRTDTIGVVVGEPDDPNTVPIRPLRNYSGRWRLEASRPWLKEHISPLSDHHRLYTIACVHAEAYVRMTRDEYLQWVRAGGEREELSKI